MPKSNTLNDQELLRLLAKGNELAFAQLFDQFWDSMCLAAFKVLKDKDVAQDLAQDVLLDIWKKRERLEIENLQAYLHTAVRYKVLKYIDKHKTPLTDLDFVDEYIEDNSSQVTLEFKELNEILQGEIAQLPDQCQKVFKMSRFEQKSNFEIAKELNLSIRTVENHISIALKRLRPRLKDAMLLSLFLIF